MQTTHSRTLALVLATIFGFGFALVASPSLAEAQSGASLSRAKAHFQRGVTFFDSGDFRAAITQFKAADKLAPSPLLDYNIGLCHERLGETGEALRRFRGYRSRAPNAANRADVDAKIARLEAIEANTAAAAVPPEPTEDPSTGLDPEAAADPMAQPDSAAAPPPAASYDPTGDPALDRVAAVNLDEVAARHPSVAAPAAPAPISGNDGGGEASGVAPPPAPKDDEDKPKPLYKRWWFWVVVGVSAIIIIDIASSGGNNNEPLEGRILMDPSLGSAASQPGGFTLRF